jgi:hypothetical protein
VNVVIACLAHPRRKICELWGCQEDTIGDGGWYTCNVSRIFNNNSAAGWIKVAIKLSNPMPFCVVYHSQQADRKAGRQILMDGGHSYHPAHGILRSPAEDMIDDIGEECNDDGVMGVF